MASKRALKRRTCERKIGYGTLAGAMRAKHRMRNKYGDTYDAYKCSYCGSFHIGHRTQSMRAKLRHQRHLAAV